MLCANLRKCLVTTAVRSPAVLRCNVPHLSRAGPLLARSFSTQQPPQQQQQQPAQNEEPQQQKTQSKFGLGGPLTWKSVGLVIVVGGGVVYLFNRRLEEKQQQLEEPKQLKSIGKPLLGGPFTLVNTQTGKPVTDEHFKGKFALLYFGFTHCPDVCPDELEKITTVCNRFEKRGGENFVPVFITLDPRRDSIGLINSYLKDFHPSFVGLTGTDPQVEEACKNYRVYFSKGPEDVDGDYLVDHTIISYLVDPSGQFCEYYAKNCVADEMERRILAAMSAYHSGAQKS